MSQQQFFGTGSVGPVIPNIQFLQGNDSVPVGPDPATHIIMVLGNTVQGLSFTNTAPYTLTGTIANATTTQIGVTSLATNAETIAGTVTTKAVTPDDLKAKLGVQTLNGLAYGGGTSAALNWLADATDGQIPIGSSGAAPVLGSITSTGGTIIWTPGPGTLNAEAVGPILQGNDLVSVTPDPATHIISLVGNTVQGISVSSTGAHQETITAANATTTQIGVTSLATNAETIAGTVTTKAVTPDDLKAKLGTQTLNGLAYGGGTAAALNWLGNATNGQLPIGSTGAAPVLAVLTSAGGTIAWTPGPGSLSGDVVAPTQQIALNYKNVTNAMSPYTVTATDYFISVDASAGAVTILLPNTTTSFREFIVKDRLGFAATNNITITTPGGVVTIDGSTSYAFTDNYESLEMLFNATSYESF